MITTGAVDEDLIAQFKNDMEAFDCVTRVSRDHGRRVKVQVEKNENGVPYPHQELGEVRDGEIKAENYVISRLTGSGHAPGEKYTHCLAVSPYCEECGENPQEGLDEDDNRCSDCSFGDNLLSSEPGTTAIVEVANEPFGARHEDGEQIEATADEDGLLRDDEEDRVFNDGRYRIVEIVDSPADDDEDDDDDQEVATDGGTELEDPITVRWTGKARVRIQGYMIDFSTDRSDYVQDTLERQKSNIVIKTVNEAGAVVRELEEYHSSLQKDWMNGAMDSALDRIRTEIIDGMEARGYELQKSSTGSDGFIQTTDKDDSQESEELQAMTDGGTGIYTAEVDTDYPLPVEEQTPLPEEIRIGWYQGQESHVRIHHSLQASYDDANENEPLIGAAYRCLNRLKTFTVVKTEEEAESLHYELQQYLHPHGIPAPQGTEATFRTRLESLEEQLEDLGYEIDTSGHRPELIPPE